MIKPQMFQLLPWYLTFWTLCPDLISQNSTWPSCPPDTNMWLSCHVPTHITWPTWPDLTWTTWPVLQSARKIWSSPAPALTRVCPPGIQAQSLTVPSWNVNVVWGTSSKLSSLSQTSATLVNLMVLSLLPVAKTLPSGDQLEKHVYFIVKKLLNNVEMFTSGNKLIPCGVCWMFW